MVLDVSKPVAKRIRVAEKVFLESDILVSLIKCGNKTKISIVALEWPCLLWCCDRRGSILVSVDAYNVDGILEDNVLHGFASYSARCHCLSPWHASVGFLRFDSMN